MGRIVAFIDLGTNSARLLLVQFQENGSYAVLSERKEAMRLGEGEYIYDRLTQEAMERGLLVCQKFMEMLRASGVDEVIAVATSATREAANRLQFLEMIRREAGLEVRIVSGLEEARLIFLGVANGFHLGTRQGLFIDIGGGSTEVVVGDQYEYQFLDTLKLGAIRLKTLFLEDEQGPISRKRYRRMQSYVRDVGVRTFEQIRAIWTSNERIAIGSSGTIENLADIAVQMEYERRRNPDDILTYSKLKAVTDELRRMTLEERAQVPGINPNRTDIILSGSAILETIMQDLEIEEISITDRGLRDGLLVDYQLRQAGKSRLAESVREASVLRIGRSLSFDEQHARQVTSLALQLFDSAKMIGLHDLGDSERELLEYASMLHDIGIRLSYTGHHVHSHYFIRNAELLGFDQEEIAIIAATAYYHRKAYPRKKHRIFAELEKDSQQTVRYLCVLLSIAESLDRSHASLVRHVEFESINQRRVNLIVSSIRECPLELWGVEHHERAFRSVFKQRLLIEQKLISDIPSEKIELRSV